MGKTKNRGYVFFGCLLLFALGFISSGNQLILMEVTEDFQMDGNTGVGILAAMSYAGMILSTLLFGGLTDRVDKKKILCIFGLVVVLGAALGCLAGGAFMVALSIFIYGIGFAIVNGTVGAALMETDPSRSNTFTNLSQMFFSLGSVVSPLLIAWLMERGMNWRGHFGIGAGLFLAAVICFFFTRRPAVPEGMKSAGDKGSFRAIACAALFLLALSIGMYVAMESGQVFFTKPYFIQELKDPQNAALSISLIWIMMIPSRVIASRIHKKKTLLVCGCFALACISCLLTALVRVPGLSLLWSALFGFAAGPIFPTIMSAAMDAFPHHTGRASSVLVTAAGIFGVLSNIGMGAVSDAIGLGNGFFMVAGFAALGILLFYLARKKSSPGRE